MPSLNFLFAYLRNLRARRLSQALSQHGRVITIAIRDSHTVDDEPHHPSPEQRFIHHVLGTWTDPQSGRMYTFERQFRSSQEFHLRTGDFAKVLLDPHNYHRYLVQIS